MSRTTSKRVIADVLEGLSTLNLDKFRFHLRGRRGDPLVTRLDVDDKSVREVADMLVSKFTEAGAVEVTLEMLREINCNEEAARLKSRTKALMDKGNPTFRRTSTGELDKAPSQEALRCQRPLRSRQAPGKTAKEVEDEAKARVRSEGGDPDDDNLVLSRSTLQFGQYKGQTFMWLLENDVGYAAYVVAGHEKDRRRNMRQDSLMDNKDSLTRYANPYREFRKVKSLHLADNGRALVGFDRFKWDTLSGLYHSTDPERISYVNYLRRMESNCDPGSPMEIAVAYILQCDQRGAGGHAPQAAGHAPQAASYPVNRSRRGQRARVGSSYSLRGSTRMNLR